MYETPISIIPNRVKALYTLVRAVPLLCWGVSSSLVGLGLAHIYTNLIDWVDYGLVNLLIVLIHGVISHAYNDREDWLSGTDPLSPGILSGGSKVIPHNYYRHEDLPPIARTALIMVLIITVYFFWKFGLPILILIAVGIWAAIGYTCPPFRLSYHPLTGEWLCAFPALLACTAGTFYVLTGKVYLVAAVAGAIHALLAIGLLMHHHLSDISSDLQAIPRKLTTVALAAIKLGVDKAPVVETVYFLMALLLGLAGGLFIHPVLGITFPFALACMLVAFVTNPKDIGCITNREYGLYCLIIGDSFIKTFLLFYIW